MRGLNRPPWISEDAMSFVPRTNLVSLNRYRDARDDAQLNAEWDRLTHLVDQAWTWRDVESLAALDECIARLLPRLRKE